MNNSLKDKSILLVISGGIAAYKSLELIRLLKKSGASVRCILTKGGEQFVTPLSVSALCEEQTYTDLWSLKDETEMGHIRLSREADLIVIAPASANIIAQMAHGLAEDLATTTLLAADKPILIAPAMNHRMWLNPATQANIETLQARGISMIGPEDGDMACGEYGPGRMAEPEDILSAIIRHPVGTNDSEGLNKRDPEKRAAQSGSHMDPRCLSVSSKRRRDDGVLKSLKALVTSGPTFEPLDPVRFIGNRSSGKQGHAIAAALAQAGAQVTLVSGPVSLPDPAGVKTIHVETADEMLSACENALPADIAVCAAAVSDWSAADTQEHKIKKRGDDSPPTIALKENPDILKTLSTHKNRPALVVGFAAETENLHDHARAKLATKNCDWILANHVASPDKKVFGEDQNHVYCVTASGIEDWQPMSKQDIAARLTEEIARYFESIKTVKDAAE